MIYLVTASKDSSVYFRYPNTNTGLDNILSISKNITNENLKEISRTYIKFDVDKIPNHITASSVELHLQITEIEQIPLEYKIYAYAVSESWDMGIGKLEDNPTFSGSISWNYQPKVIYTVQSSQSYDYEDADIKMDIKSLYNHWTASGNYGIRLSHSESIESSSLSYGYLRFYSKETNTFRQPVLKIGFDDQVFITGSLTGLPVEKDIIVKSKGLKPIYPLGKIVKFNFAVREKYPLKTMTDFFPYEKNSYLPQSSYYAIKDVITNLPIIDFNQNTKISCGISGSFVKIDTTNYPTNRPLKFEFLVERDGVTEKYEDDLTFIVR